MNHDKLVQYIKKAPKEAGVYIWRDARWRPLYVGKASSLKSRLSSYAKTADPRILNMVAKATTLAWQTTPTDIEALILEAQLIKRWHPPYNIVMRDDKQYFYVAFTPDDFPRVYLTHQPPTSALGPFTDGAPLKSTLRVLRRLFPYCTCKQKHYVPCLNSHMGLCPGFCCLKVPSTRAQVLSYRKNIRAIREVLSGKRDSLIARMHKAGHDVGPVIRVFQNAQINARHQAIANSQDGALAQLAAQFGLAGPPQRIEGYDIAHIQDRHATGAMVVFTNGRYDKAQSRLFNIKEDLQGDVPMLRHVIQRRLTHPEWPGPDLVLVDGGLAQLNLAAKLFKNIPVIALTKDERHQGDHVLSSLDRKVRPLAALPRPIRDLLVQIDNEAHRRAIGQYRRLHRRSIA